MTSPVVFHYWIVPNRLHCWTSGQLRSYAAADRSSSENETDGVFVKDRPSSPASVRSAAGSSGKPAGRCSEMEGVAQG